jgi:hypothetical protein
MTTAGGRVQEQVERARHHAFGGVLHRHHAELGAAGGGGVEHLVEAGAARITIGRAEELERGLLADRFRRCAAGRQLGAVVQRDQRHALGGAAQFADLAHAGAHQHALVGDQHDLVVGRTSVAATTLPLRSLCWMAIMPLVPRPWRVYSTIGVRLP